MKGNDTMSAQNGTNGAKGTSKYLRGRLLQLEFQAVIADYVADLRIRRLSANTILIYERTLRRLLTYLAAGQPSGAAVRMAAVTPERVQGYVRGRMEAGQVYTDHPMRKAEDRALSPHSLHQEIRSLMTFGRWLVRQDYEDPFKGLRVPKLPKRMIDVLSHDEITRLFQAWAPATAFGARWQAMMAFALDTGVRVEELVNLRVDRIDTERGRARVVGKGDKERFVRFGSRTQRALARYTNLFRPDERGAPTVFTSLDGAPLTVNGAENILKNARRRAGVERCHWHLFRHTFATMFILGGGDALELKDLLGHETLKMTDQYVHLAQQLGLRDSLRSRRQTPLDSLDVEMTPRARRGRPLAAGRRSEPHPEPELEPAE